MEVQRETPEEQIKRLQRCINDLVTVLVLPAMWSGSEPTQMVDRLLDALLGMLQLALVYVRVNGPASEEPIEAARVAPSHEGLAQTQEICRAITHGSADDPQKWPSGLQVSIGDGNISIVPSRLGLHEHI